MLVARRMLMAMGLASLAVPPAAAQVTTLNGGRSVATLSRIPLTTRAGKAIRLGSRIKPGKPTLIAFWASWCGPCYAEAPTLNRIRRETGDRYNFLYINRSLGNPDPEQPAEDIATFLGRTGMGDVDYLFADVAAYRSILGVDVGTIPGGRVGIPRVYLFDRKGKQIYSSLGFIQADGLNLERLVKQAVTS